MRSMDVPYAIPPAYLDCRAQDDIDALQLARFNLAVKQNVARRERARADAQTTRLSRFGITPFKVMHCGAERRP